MKLVSALAAGLLLSAAATGQTATFRIHDHLDEAEVEETTSVYIDGVLVRVIHLDAGHTDEVFEVPASAGDSAVSYALCGQIAIKRPSGLEELHEVDGSGVLQDVAGRDYDAVAALDFTLFYLKDITADRPTAEILVRQVKSCAEALS